MAAQDQAARGQIAVTGTRVAPGSVAQQENRERYAGEAVAAVQSVADTPVSTFSIDVDTGSYANVRRMLTQGQMPPEGAVRTEEMLNYFRYNYPLPRDRSTPPHGSPPPPARCGLAGARGAPPDGGARGPPPPPTTPAPTGLPPDGVIAFGRLISRTLCAVSTNGIKIRL